MVALMAAGTLGELSAQVNGSWAGGKGSGVWSDSLNWTGAPSPVPGGANSTVTLNTGLSSSITVTIDGAVGNRTVGILDFGLTRTFTVAGSSGGSLTFDNGASSAQINVAVGKNATISANTTLTSSVLITHAGNILSLSGLISGPGGITKNGTGNLTMSFAVANTYGGGFTLNQGAVDAGNGASFGNGTLTINGGQILNGSGGRSYSNAVVIGGNATLGGVGVGTNTYTGNVTLANGNRTLEVVGTTILGGNISDVGIGYSLTKNGAGVLTLGFSAASGGNNTFSGGFVLNEGLLTTNGADGTNSQFGTGTLTLNGGAIFSGVASRTFANTLILGGNVNLNNGGLAISYNGNATLTGNRILTSTGASATSLNGIMSDGGAGYGFTKEGNGTLSLTAANTHSGITTVNNGTLALGHVNAVQHSTLDAGASGAQSVTFTVSGNNTYNLGGLQGSDAIAIGNNTLSIGAKNTDTVYSGDLSGGGRITRCGRKNKMTGSAPSADF